MTDHDATPALAQLHPTERSAMLDWLLARHAELRDEAEAFALETLTDIDVDAVAGEVVDVFLGMDHTLIGARSGRQPGRGYVHRGRRGMGVVGGGDRAVRRRGRATAPCGPRRRRTAVRRWRADGPGRAETTAGETTVFGWGPPDEAAAELGARITEVVGSDARVR